MTSDRLQRSHRLVGNCKCLAFTQEKRGALERVMYSFNKDLPDANMPSPVPNAEDTGTERRLRRGKN